MGAAQPAGFIVYPRIAKKRVLIQFFRAPCGVEKILRSGSDDRRSGFAINKNHLVPKSCENANPAWIAIKKMINIFFIITSNMLIIIDFSRYDSNIC
jgi:hypothetical protein